MSTDIDIDLYLRCAICRGAGTILLAGAETGRRRFAWSGQSRSEKPAEFRRFPDPPEFLDFPNAISRLGFW